MTSEAKKVVIVGGGLGGLSAAIHLRLAGLDVTLCEANEKVGGRANLIERSGFRFDTGPTLVNYPWVFEQLFHAAGRNLKDYVELLPVDPSVTFRWADGSHLSLSSDVRRFLRECERLEPGVSPAVFAFLRDATTKYRIAFDKLIARNVDSPFKWFGSLRLRELWAMSIWRSLDGELRRFFRDPHLREALGSYGMYLGGSPFDLPGIFTILSYGELAYGLWLPKGGVYGLVAGIERLALDLGVEIRTSCRIAKIKLRNQQVEGVELEDGTLLATNVVVSNVDVPTTNTQLIDARDGVRKRFEQEAVNTKMTPSVVTFYWGVQGPVAGLNHHTIFLPRDFKQAFADLFERKRVPRELPFYVSVPSATDPSLAPPGHTSLFVLAPVPLLSQMGNADWRAEADKIKEEVLATLSFHNVNLDPAKIRVEEIYTPPTWQKRFGLYDGSAFGAAHTLNQVGPFRSRNFCKEIPGLYYTGASTTPGTGLPMVVLSGRLVAERIVSHAR